MKLLSNFTSWGCGETFPLPRLKIVMFIAQEKGCGSMVGKYWKEKSQKKKLNLSGSCEKVGKPTVRACEEKCSVKNIFLESEDIFPVLHS